MSLAPPATATYAFLNIEEAAFVEALVDHMVPADEHSPKGTDLGINVDCLPIATLNLIE